MKRFLGLVVLLAACSPANRAVEPLASSPPVQVEVTTLNAGEIDDNSAWDQYIEYRESYLQWGSRTVRDVDVSTREDIVVADAQGLPVLGARVMVYGEQNLIAESRTDASGRTRFFPQAWEEQAQSYRVVVQKDDTAVEFTLDPWAAAQWNVELNTATQSSAVQLDVLFLLDATGSMADEIAQLQNNILAISDQINALPGNIAARYGLVTYKDRGDDYVTQTYDFVADVADFQARLSDVRAGGGGDTPESLNEALHVAVQEVGWRGDDTVKLVFLVADAAPHLDYANDYDYSQEMVAAAWRGIKIHPIASSGLRQDGEFIFRQIAQYTMGRFVFLTYEQGTSGQPGSNRSDLAAGNGNYGVEQLDDMVLRFVTDEITSLTTPVGEQVGIRPQLQPTTLHATNQLPAHFALAQSQPQIVANPQQSAPVSGGQILPVSVIFFGPLVVMIALLCLFIGYSVNGSRWVEKRKRKNEEFVVESID